MGRIGIVDHCNTSAIDLLKKYNQIHIKRNRINHYCLKLLTSTKIKNYGIN